MKYENGGLIITFPQITWIERRFDERSDIDYAVVHFRNGEDAFRAWCDMNSHVVTGDC